MAEIPTTGTAMMHTLQRHRDILNVILAMLIHFFRF